MQHDETVHLTEVQVAQRLGLTVKALQDWRRRRVGPLFMKIGAGPHARVRYSLTALEAWERARTVATDADADVTPRATPERAR